MQSVEVLKEILLVDSEDNRSTVISVKGAESGFDFTEVITQSPMEREQAIATRHRIYTEEIDLSASQDKLKS